MQNNSNVIKKGYLSKKSPSGLKGFRTWQKRFFVVDNKAISYYKHEDDIEPMGVIPLMNVTIADYLPDKRVGCRFDIKVKSLRTYSLDAPSVGEAKLWVKSINKAIEDAKADMDNDGKQEDEDDGQQIKLSKLQQEFFKARYQDVEPKPKVSYMKKEYPTDATVLKFLLQEIIDARVGHFLYDLQEHKQDVDVKAAANGEFTGTGSGGVGAGVTNLAAVRSATELSVASPRDGMSEKDKLMAAKPSEPTPEMLTLARQMSKRPCCIIACKDACINGNMYCDGHMQNRGSSKKLYHEFHPIIDLLKSKQLMRIVLDIFKTAEVEAHGLAVRVLWCLFRGIYSRKVAAQQFASYIEIYCQGQRFNLEIKNSLMTILLAKPHEVTQDLERARTIAFYQPVRHPETWQAIFGCLKECNFEIRKLALEDINTILHDSLPNCLSVASTPGWQSWVWPIFTDIPKAKEQDPIKSVFAYAINVITLVHYQFYMKTEVFLNCLNGTLASLQQFGGSNTEGCDVAGVALCALASKLRSQNKNFSPSARDTLEWRNLIVLDTLCRTFIFQTNYWQTFNESDQAENSVSGSETFGDEETSGAPPTPTSNGAAIRGDPRKVAVSAAMRKQTRKNTEEDPSVEAPKGENDNNSEFVLYSKRAGKSDKAYGSELEITDHGLHWSDTGKPIDIRLVKKLLQLYKQLNLDQENASGGVAGQSREEKDFASDWKRIYDFWEDSQSLMGSITRQDITFNKQLTYRKFAFMVRTFIEGDRKAVFEELRKILHKKGAGGVPERGSSSRQLVIGASTDDEPSEQKEGGDRDNRALSPRSNPRSVASKAAAVHEKPEKGKVGRPAALSSASSASSKGEGEPDEEGYVSASRDMAPAPVSKSQHTWGGAADQVRNPLKSHIVRATSPSNASDTSVASSSSSGKSSKYSLDERNWNPPPPPQDDETLEPDSPDAAADPEPEPVVERDPAWSAHVDPNTGATFYYNSRTGETTWYRPEGYQP